jgi:anti-sigma factor (TIGR02949 family)
MTAADPTPPDHPVSDHHDHAEGYCREAIRDLYLFLDRELSDAQAEAISAHLNECSPCFEAFDFEAELRIVIRSRVTAEMPEGLRDRLLSMLDSPEPPAGSSLTDA